VGSRKPYSRSFKSLGNSRYTTSRRSAGKHVTFLKDVKVRGTLPVRSAMKGRYSRYRRGGSSSRLVRAPLGHVVPTLALRNASYTINSMSNPSGVDRQNHLFIAGPNTPGEIGSYVIAIQGSPFANPSDQNQLADYIRFFNLIATYTLTFRPPPAGSGAASPGTTVPGVNLQLYILTARQSVPRTSEWNDMPALYTQGFTAQLTDTSPPIADKMAELSTSPYQNPILTHYFHIRPLKLIVLDAARPEVNITLKTKMYKWNGMWDNPNNYLAVKGSQYILGRYCGVVGIGSATSEPGVSGLPHHSLTAGVGIITRSRVQYVVDYNARASFQTSEFMAGPAVGETIHRMGFQQVWGPTTQPV